MKKYFIYELRKRAFPIGYLTLITVALYTVPIMTSQNLMRGATETFVWIISLLGGFLATFVPVWMFNYKMKKQSVDLFYSLPLSHTKILTVRFLVGMLAIYIPYTAAYWLGAFAAMARAFGEMDAIYYLPQFFASLIPIYFIYAISAFAFTRANKLIDGLAFIVFAMFAVSLVMLVLQQLTAKDVTTGYDEEFGYLFRTVYCITPHYYLPFAPLDFLTGHFEQHIAEYMNLHNVEYGTAQTVNIILGFTLTSLMAAGSTAGLFLTEKRAKAENAGQISESRFGYKTMIPLYTVCLAGVCRSLILYVLIIACTFFLTVAYRRTFKIGKVQAIVFPVSAVVGLILCVIIQMI